MRGICVLTFLLFTARTAVADSHCRDSVGVDSLAPDFLLKAMNGGDIQLKSFIGHPILVSFIHVHTSTQAEHAQATRAQMAFLKSMINQYGNSGLKLVLIAGKNGHNSIPQQTLINFMFDHELDFIPLLEDTEYNSVADLYSVDVLPTTFLVTKDGMIAQRWNNVALTAQMALAIEAEISDHDNWSLPAQLIFPGLPGARPLSEKMWLIDGGKTWKHNDPQPFRLLIADEDSVRVRLDVTRDGSDRPVRSVEFAAASIPKSECDVLFSNFSWKPARACSIVSSLSIAEPGRYAIRVFTLKPGDNRVVLKGSVEIEVQ